MFSKTQIINTVKQFLPDVAAIYQFGSTGTIYETKESDLDIAILSGSKINT